MISPILMTYAACIVSTVLTLENLALLKPAYQSSTENLTKDGKDFPGKAELVVDGNKNSDYYGESCNYIRTEWFPWWMVDLGDVYLIEQVEITAMNFTTQKLRNFTIESSQYIEGEPTNGVLVNPAYCYGQLKPQVRATKELYTCEKPVMARYLKIWKYHNGQKQPLYFCEVEVLGSKTERFFESQLRRGRKSQNPLVATHQVESPTHCSILCWSRESCTSFNIQKRRHGYKTCELINDRSSSLDKITNEINDPEWDHYFIKSRFLETN